MNQEKINFPEARDFSGIFNASVKFVSQNFKHFFQSLIFIAGPFLLIDSVCIGFFQVNMIQTTVKTSATGGFQGFNSIGFWSQYAGFLFIVILFAILARIILLTTTYAYVLAYEMHGPKNFSVADVRKIVFQNITKTIKGFFVCVLLLFFFFLVVGIIFGVIGALIMSMLPQLLSSIILVLLVIAAAILSPPFIWQFSTFYLVQMKEDEGVLDSMRKVREIMRGEFIQTWAIVVVSLVILIILSLLFSIPTYIYQGGLRVSNTEVLENAIPYIVISTVCGFLIKFINSLFYIVNSFLYYSLDEKKNGTALISKIDEIGNTPVNDGDQQY